jgi:predicted transcriptional regulator
MNRPNITLEEAQAYITASKTSITNSINSLVDAGRITRKEADEYLSKATSGLPENAGVFVLAIRGYYKTLWVKREKMIVESMMMHLS